MSNKLKKIFSDEEISFGGKINFKDHEAYSEFIRALDTVYEEGRAVRVNGVVSIETLLHNGDSEYPFEEHGKIEEFIVAPSVERVPFRLNTEFGEKVIDFNRYYTNQGAVLQTSEQAIIYLKLFFEKNTRKLNFTYSAKPELAKSVKELVENYSIVLSLFERWFTLKDNDKNNSDELEEWAFVENAKDYFKKMFCLYKKLDYVEQELRIVFEPAKLTQNEKDWLELEEVYLVLREKKAIRINAKMTEIEIAELAEYQVIENLKIGNVLALTYISSAEYFLWEKTIKLHTVNLLSNAIVKEIKKMPNDKIKIIYSDEDSRPMYISYRGFKTQIEAEQELKDIMCHKEIYENALTVRDYIARMDIK